MPSSSPVPAAGLLRFGISGKTSDHVWRTGDGLASLPGVTIVAGAEPYAELREKPTAQWGIERIHEDYTTMLERWTRPLCTTTRAKQISPRRRGKVLVYQDEPLPCSCPSADRIREKGRQ